MPHCRSATCFYKAR